MWDSSMLKENAKSALKGFYWKAVLVSIITGLLAGSGGSSGRAGGSSAANSDSYDELINSIESSTGGSADEQLAAFVVGVLVVVGIILVVALIIGMVYAAFVAYPIKVGEIRFYLDGRRNDVSVGKVFYQFKDGRYMATVKGMFSMYVKIWLWSLLFIIPGIIKTYEYFLVPYILAENPNISRERAFQISKETMNGEKMNLFLLCFSFIGWFFLGAITLVGTVFVMPYYNATLAEFYCCMREKALSRGIASPSELFDDFSQPAAPQGFFGGGYSPVQPQDPYAAQGQPYQSYQPYQSAPQAPEAPQPQQPASTTMDSISFDDFNSGNDSSNDNNNDSYNGPDIL